jgi:hypothetical protein
MHEELKSVKMIDKTNIEKIGKYIILVIYKIKIVKNLISSIFISFLFKEIDTFKIKLQFLWKKIQEFKSLCNKSIDALTGEQNNVNQDLNNLELVIIKHKNFNSDNCHKKKLQLATQLEKKELSKEYDYNKVEDLCTLLVKTGT